MTNYQTFGEKKEVLLILPGWGRSMAEWLPVAKSLSDKYKVIVLDLPGFGATALPKENAGVFEYAEFVSRFLAKLRIGKCIILGHSFGGRPAIILASQGKLVEKLVLVDSGGVEGKSWYAMTMRILRLLFSPVLAVLPSLARNRISSLVGSEDYKNSGQMRKIFVRIVNQDLRHLLPKIDVPTFIIWGDKDQVLPVSQAKIFKNGINDSKIRIVWGAGHDPHLQKPEQFIAILKDIL